MQDDDEDKLENLEKEVLLHALDQDSLYYALRLGSGITQSDDQVVSIVNNMYRDGLFSVYRQDESGVNIDVPVGDFE